MINGMIRGSIAVQNDHEPEDLRRCTAALPLAGTESICCEAPAHPPACPPAKLLLVRAPGSLRTTSHTGQAFKEEGTVVRGSSVTAWTTRAHISPARSVDWKLAGPTQNQ